MNPPRRRRDRGDEPAPDFAPDQRAGELQIGSYSHWWLYERSRKLPERKQPFGFRAPAR